MQADRRIQRILEILERGVACDVRELGRVVNLSSSRLQHLFKAQTGSCLSDYSLELRLLKAAALLQFTDIRIKEITYMAGYSHSPSFTRAFKKRFCATPQGYRQAAPIFAKK